MDWLSILIGVLTPLLAGLVAGLVSLVGLWFGRIQAKEKARLARAQALDDMRIMQENSKLAVQAAEQLGKDLAGEEKAKMALEFAQTWNKLAGVLAPPDAIVPLNEANVLVVPKKITPSVKEGG
jgi:hypothetical protein